MGIGAVATMESYTGPMSATQFGSELITSTIDRLNTSYVGTTPVLNSDYAAHISVLNSAYTNPSSEALLDLTV